MGVGSFTTTLRSVNIIPIARMVTHLVDWRMLAGLGKEHCLLIRSTFQPLSNGLCLITSEFTRLACKDAA